MGTATRDCGCGGGRPPRAMATARPTSFQFYVFDRPGGEFSSTSWGAAVVAAQAAGVRTGRVVVRSMLNGQIQSERLVGSVTYW